MTPRRSWLWGGAGTSRAVPAATVSTREGTVRRRRPHPLLRGKRSKRSDDVHAEMTMSATTSDLPNVAAALAQVLQRVPRRQQPLLIAIAERLAADRYRGWAAEAAGA